MQFKNKIKKRGRISEIKVFCLLRARYSLLNLFPSTFTSEIFIFLVILFDLSLSRSVERPSWARKYIYRIWTHTHTHAHYIALHAMSRPCEVSPNDPHVIVSKNLQSVAGILCDIIPQVFHASISSYDKNVKLTANY